MVSPPASNSRLGSEFDAFLFAPLGEDRNGLPLSIVSLLARMDLDPWQEAATLASLPAEAAAQKLGSLLNALPAASLQQADPGTVATRLIALLPRRTDPEARSPLALVSAGALTRPQVVMNAILLAIYLILLLGNPFAVARHDAPAHADTTHVPPSVTGPSQTPPSASGK